MVSLLFLVACGVENDVGAVDPDPTGSETEAPGAYVYGDGDDTAPDVDLDALTLALEDAADRVLAIDPTLWIGAYQQAMTWEDGYCPYHYEDYVELYGYDYWYGGCDTEDGGRFDGYAYGTQNSGPTESGVYTYWHYGWLGGELSIEHADGEALDLAGYFYVQDYEVGPNRYHYAQLDGSIRWEGEQRQGSWLSDGLSANIIISGGYSETAGSYLNLDGGLSTGDAQGSAVWFDGVLMAQEARGHDCPVEPSGVVSVRAEDGTWYDVLFDGAPYIGGEVFPAACDGCGEVWVDGRAEGTVCPDLSVLTDWTSRPW